MAIKDMTWLRKTVLKYVLSWFLLALDAAYNHSKLTESRNIIDDLRVRNSELEALASEAREENRSLTNLVFTLCEQIGSLKDSLDDPVREATLPARRDPCQSNASRG